MMLIGYANYVMLGVVVMCFWYTSILITIDSGDIYSISQ